MGAGSLKGSGLMSSIWCRKSLCWLATNINEYEPELASSGVALRGWFLFWGFEH